jgi:hypothetical protein
MRRSNDPVFEIAKILKADRGVEESLCHQDVVNFLHSGLRIGRMNILFTQVQQL